MVTTGHQKFSKMGQNSIKSFFFCPKGKKSLGLGRSPLQELEVGPRSGPYLLVVMKGRRTSSTDGKYLNLIICTMKLYCVIVYITQSVAKAGGLISLIVGLFSLISGLISIIGGPISLFVDPISPIFGQISLIGDLISLIGGLISLIGGLISLIGGLISLIGGLISLIGGLISLGDIA